MSEITIEVTTKVDGEVVQSSSYLSVDTLEEELYKIERAIADKLEEYSE